MGKPKLISTREAARQIGTAGTYIADMCRQGRIPATQPHGGNGRWVILLSDWREFKGRYKKHAQGPKAKRTRGTNHGTNHVHRSKVQLNVAKARESLEGKLLLLATLEGKLVELHELEGQIAKLHELMGN